MKRNEVEAFMKSRGMKSWVIVINEHDPLGVGVELRGGFLYDIYTDHRVDRKVDIWGYIAYKEGKPVRFPFAQ